MLLVLTDHEIQEQWRRAQGIKTTSHLTQEGFDLDHSYYFNTTLLVLTRLKVVIYFIEQ